MYMYVCVCLCVCVCVTVKYVGFSIKKLNICIYTIYWPQYTAAKDKPVKGY